MLVGWSARYKVQGSRARDYGMSMDRTQAMAARFAVTAPLTAKTLPTEHKFKLIYSDVPNCLFVCIAGCWNGSLLAKEIPYMHVNNITDSNSDSNLFTLQLWAHVVLILCYLCWWSFLPPTSAFTLLAHRVLHLLLALVVFFYLQLPHLLYCHMWWSHCYLHCVVVVEVVVCICYNTSLRDVADL